jgi:hypothetical protein
LVFWKTIKTTSVILAIELLRRLDWATAFRTINAPFSPFGECAEVMRSRFCDGGTLPSSENVTLPYKMWNCHLFYKEGPHSGTYRDVRAVFDRVACKGSWQLLYFTYRALRKSVAKVVIFTCDEIVVSVPQPYK